MSLAHDKYMELQRLRNADPLPIEPQRTALMIIDMQEYFLNSDSPFSRACNASVPGVLDYFQERGRTIVEPALQRLLTCFRTHHMRVIYTTVASELTDGSDLMPVMKQRNAISQERQQEAFIPARTDAWARIVPILEPQDNELVINKTTYGTFTSTGLDHTLRNLGITTLVIGGVVTNVCVETTARDASDLGYGVILVDDACAAHSPEIHEASLLSFQGPFGRVRSTDDIVTLIEQAARDAALAG
jgi:nicotinamidase-related amidase